MSHITYFVDKILYPMYCITCFIYFAIESCDTDYIESFTIFVL